MEKDVELKIYFQKQSFWVERSESEFWEFSPFFLSLSCVLEAAVAVITVVL